MATVTMAGLDKPLSRRGAPVARRPHPFAKSALFASSASSYEDDHRGKYRRQRKERAKWWLARGSLALAVAAAVSRSRSASVESVSSDNNALRGGSAGAAEGESVPDPDSKADSRAAEGGSVPALAPEAGFAPAPDGYQMRVFNRDTKWDGKTYSEAVQFCSNLGEGYSLCPYHAICPVGHGSQPQSHPPDLEAEALYVPISDKEDDWVLLGQPEPGRAHSCMRHSTMYPHPPAWGAIGDEARTRRLHCCSGGDALPPDPSIVEQENTLGLGTGQSNQICKTEIPIDLAAVEQWQIPYTSLLGNGRVATDAIAKEVVLLKKEEPYGSLGEQLSSFFHAYDVAHDKGMPLYITKDSWAIDTLSVLFLGAGSGYYDAAAKHLHSHLERILRVKVVESAESLSAHSISDPAHLSPKDLFFSRSDGLDAAQVRDHRETILRRLFQHPVAGACSTFEKMLQTTGIEGAKYTVIHVNQEANAYLPKLKEASGKKHWAATMMYPEYVLNILQQQDMLDGMIFPIFSGGGASPEDNEVVARLSKVPELGKLIRHDKSASHRGGDIYMALLADLYLGTPTDHLSMWIARMRLALNIAGTYVLTENNGNGWVSYVDGDSHLELYDAKHLGMWMG